MQKVSYMGNGETTEFYFNFPFFENSNVVVEKNGTPATGYNVVGTSAGMDADIPYIGGKVVFETAPTALDCITIARQLPLSRIVDYQPTAKIEPTILNQDLNYLMEVLKDRKDELEDLTTKYAEIADKESTETILARITEIHNEIVALGDISTLRTDVTTLKGYDYVIESQAPTASTNYTWYRKYKSGWVEQGGAIQGNGTLQNINFPIPFVSQTYSVTIGNTSDSSDIRIRKADGISSQYTTYFTCYTQNGDWKWWEAKGVAAI